MYGVRMFSTLFIYMGEGMTLTNMYDVSMFVHHDVSIVSVLDLKKVANEGVGCHAADEVTTSLGHER